METRPRADAQPVNDWCGCRELRPDFLHGEEVFCYLDHSRGNLKGPGAFSLPAHAISTKNKHLLAIYSIPTRGFTAAVSVFRGTPPAKPLICKFKIRLVRLGDAVFWWWAHPTGEASLLVLAKFKLSPEDITWMSLCSCSQIVYPSSLIVHFHAVQGK